MRRNFPCEFILADVKTLIIGADFLAHFNISINMNNRYLNDNSNSLSVSATVADTKTTGIRSATAADSIYSKNK